MTFAMDEDFAACASRSQCEPNSLIPTKTCGTTGFVFPKNQHDPLCFVELITLIQPPRILSRPSPKASSRIWLAAPPQTHPLPSRPHTHPPLRPPSHLQTSFCSPSPHPRPQSSSHPFGYQTAAGPACKIRSTFCCHSQALLQSPSTNLSILPATQQLSPHPREHRNLSQDLFAFPASRHRLCSIGGRQRTAIVRPIRLLASTSYLARATCTWATTSRTLQLRSRPLPYSSQPRRCHRTPPALRATQAFTPRILVRLIYDIAARWELYEKRNAMLQTPMTPPYEDSTATFGTDNGVRPPTDALADPPMVNATNSNAMSSVNRLETPDMDDDKGADGSVDEDQDMSDGGATLTMTHTHDALLDTGLVQLESGLFGLEQHLNDMESEHLLDMESGSASPSSTAPTTLHVESVTQNPTYAQQQPPDASMEEEAPPPTHDNAVLPTTLSAVSLQLQHLQDGLDLGEVGMAADDQEGSFANTSNESISLFPNSSSTSWVEPSTSSAFGAAPEAVEIPNVQHDASDWPPATNAAPLVSLEDHVPFEELADNMSDADHSDVEDHYNLSLGEFLYNWGRSATLVHDQQRKRRAPHLSSVFRQRDLDPLEPVRRSDLQGELCDMQRINWTELGVSRQEAKRMRMRLYNNYRNVRPQSHHSSLLNQGVSLVDDENYFRFRRMDFDHNVKLTHFQLRNVMACASRGHVFYAGRSRVWQWNPSSIKNKTGPSSVAMELTNMTIQPLNGIPGGMQISTLDTAHDILVAGGFCGEYALINLKSHKDTKHTEGLITDELNAITNHVQVHQHRGSSLPVAAFSSNDTGFRVLDVNTNTFIQENKYDCAMNCSAISPDQRLRVCVGDTRDVMICNSDTGEILQRLDGHRDFGFACDWADDGWTVATGNQDMQVKIWDARKWKSASGSSYPITTIESEMAGVRKLKFSPLGSGKRVLVAAEPADVISIIDAQTFTSKQTLNFFGEIGGVDFTNDGQDLFVANSDNMRGGIIQYERCGLADDGLHRLESNRQYRQDGRSRGYDWMSDEDELVAHPKARRTAAHRQRKAADLGVTIGHF